MPSHFFKNGSIGVLLLHGFTANPNELLDLGQFLSEKNLTVSIPSLPGHETHAADLLNFTWHDWSACAEKALEELSEVCHEVFVCGLSMGGTLALRLAAHKPVSAVVSMSAPVKFPRWQVLAAKSLKRVRRYRWKKHGEDVRDTSMRAKLRSYRRYPYYAVHQLFELAGETRQELPLITQPILVIHSMKDHTVPFENARIIFDSVSSRQKRKVDLTESFHIITVDVEKERVWAEIWEFLSELARGLQ